VLHGKGWEQIGETYPSAASPAGDKDGNVYFADPRSSRIYKADASGHVTSFASQTAGAQTLRVGADGRLYAAQPARHRLVSYAPAGGAETVVAQGLDVRDFVLTRSGAIYFTELARKTVGVMAPGGARRVAYDGGAIDAPSALTLSPDQSRLEVTDARGKFGWSFQLAKDGSLAGGQPFWRLEFSEQADMRGVDGIAVDAFGYLYVPTVLGIELSNQIGRVEHILNKPAPTATVTHVAFGGADRTWLYVTTTAGTVYRRQLTRTGAAAWAPAKPPAPRL
jgi:gluconolactonase